jgi:magnesium chelatase subunit D
VQQRSLRRGRPIGAEAGELRTGARLHLVETLKAAAPWQLLRGVTRDERMRLAVRRSDFRIVRFRHRSETLMIFAVDASGSSALHRLAEAKGAIELLLADCYVRRDKVALIAFRGRGAELLLAPTGALVRAKRCLAGLPGGGGTPLAAGLDAAAVLADAARRKGQTPILTVLTDGRANVASDGGNDRMRAEADAIAAARRIRAAGFAVLLVDTAPRPDERTRRLGVELGAKYLPLPQADAALLSQAVRTAARPAAAARPPGAA